MSEDKMEESYNFLPPEDDLLGWYQENKRDLPWRRDKDPYHIWVSEIMLQQTRVEAVKEYYRRFMDALPTIADLADADEDTYMKLWEGLGYYSRIRNMHKAAGVIVQDYGGAMPRTQAELLKLPGIGAYTASAIASIAFNERTPAVDGNLLRIFSRMTHYKEDIKKPAARRAAESWYLAIMSDRDPGSFNQALMDLGACICIPKGDPACLADPAACPWSRCCKSCQNADPQDYPKTAPKKSRRVEERTVFLIQHGGQIALRKRPAAGLLAGLWEFPNTLGKLNRSQALQYTESLGFSPLKIKKLPAAKHVFSHVEWRMTGWQILADEWRPLTGSEEGTDEQMPLAESQNKEPSTFPDNSSGIILADAEEVREHYSIPSAFQAFKTRIL
jgi:A/G-specific adenine glycosylase